jgi:phage tail-like protein
MGSDELNDGTYLQYLPATFAVQRLASPNVTGGEQLQPDPFLGRFLLAFERILSGLPQVPPQAADGGVAGLPPGIEQVIASLAKYFLPLPSTFVNPDDPAFFAPAEFLPWLAGWVAVSLRGDWSEAQQRAFIARIPSLYKIRGTVDCMRQMLQIYLGSTAEVTEPADPPHYFTVTVHSKSIEPTALQMLDRAVRAIVDQEKPAHTFYGLQILVPTMVIPVIVGVTTTLGAIYTPDSSSSTDGT